MMTNHRRVLVPVSHPLGGIRTYMLYNFRRLHEEGYRFTFLSEAGSVFDTFKHDLVDWDGTEFIEVPHGGGSRAVCQAIRRTLKKESFTLIHSQGLKAGTESAIANFFSRTPHLITLHDVIVPQNDIPGLFKWLKKAIISFVTRRASVIIPVSQDCEANHLQLFPAWKCGSVKVETILNGVDVEKILQSKAAFESGGQVRLREENGIESDIPLGGFFGRFMPQKGFDLLLKAMEWLVHRGYENRFRLVVTKDLNGYLNETIRDVTKNPKIARMVRFIDPVADITPILSQIDLLLMPSRWEACGLLAMEAMIVGKPVIGSDCLGLREVLHGTPSATPKQGNAEALAEALIDFIDHPVTDAAKNYAAQAAKRFDVRIATDHLLKIYQSVESSETRS